MLRLIMLIASALLLDTTFVTAQSSDQNTWEGMVRSPNGANCVQKYSTLIEPFYAIEGCATLVRSALGVATVKADCPSTATGEAR